MSDIVLQGRGIDKYFGSGKHRRQVLFGVDIDVYAGECLAVIGGSGSGKTRFFVKPNLMQMHSSYVVTDPNGNLQ